MALFLLWADRTLIFHLHWWPPAPNIPNIIFSAYWWPLIFTAYYVTVRAASPRSPRSSITLWIILTLIGGTWLSTSTDIIISRSRPDFWMAALISLLVANLLHLSKYRSRFERNILVLLNVVWAVIGLLMAQSARDTFFFEPGLFFSKRPLNFMLFITSNDWCFVRLGGFVILVFCAVIVRRGASSMQTPIPWWRVFTTPRNIVQIRNVLHEIDEWGKDMPLIGGTFKTLTGLWKATRRFKTGGEPITIYDVGVLATGTIGGLALVILGGVSISEIVVAGSGHQSSLLGWADPGSWLLAAFILYVLGWWRRESLFVFVATALTLVPAVREHVWDALFTTTTDERRGLLLIIGGTLLLFTIGRFWRTFGRSAHALNSFSSGNPLQERPK